MLLLKKMGWAGSAGGGGRCFLLELDFLSDLLIDYGFGGDRSLLGSCSCSSYNYMTEYIYFEDRLMTEPSLLIRSFGKKFLYRFPPKVHQIVVVGGLSDNKTLTLCNWSCVLFVLVLPWTELFPFDSLVISTLISLLGHAEAFPFEFWLLGAVHHRYDFLFAVDNLKQDLIFGFSFLLADLERSKKFWVEGLFSEWVLRFVDFFLYRLIQIEVECLAFQKRVFL